MKPPSLARVRRNFTALRGDFTPTSRQLHANFTQLHMRVKTSEAVEVGRGVALNVPRHAAPPPTVLPDRRPLARSPGARVRRVSRLRTAHSTRSSRPVHRSESTVGSARGDPSAHTNIPNAESTAAHSLAPFSPTCKVRAARQHAPGDISLTHLRRQLPAIAQAPRTELASYMP